VLPVEAAPGIRVLIENASGGIEGIAYRDKHVFLCVAGDRAEHPFHRGPLSEQALMAVNQPSRESGIAHRRS
jgi:hypothetical protein